MPLTPHERLFIEHRRSRKHVGLYILPVILLAVLGGWLGMFILWPEAVNPKAIWGAIEAGTIQCGSGTLSSYASAAAVLANVVFVLIAATVVLRIAWSSDERRYLRLIDKLEKEGSNPLVTPTTASTHAPTRPTTQQ